MTKDWQLHSNDPLTSIAKNNGINTWGALMEFIKKLPYGRNENRKDLTLVIIEKKGTCSSKHAALKDIADKNNIPGVQLILGMYKMNHLNTPKIGKVLLDNSISYLPEAHCYLKINNQRIDLTTENSDMVRMEGDIIEELEINPDQVSEFKVNYHKDFLKKWITANQLPLDFHAIWQIREKCIQNLSKK